MASPKFNGAGKPFRKSKVVNSPGNSCMAKIIWCRFHCNLSSILSSAKRFIMFGYAPKKMCKPVSIQSPSSSCHAETFPPSTSRASNTMGLCPASAKYLAHAKPESPPPTIATVFGSTLPLSAAILDDSFMESRKFSVSLIPLGCGKSSGTSGVLVAGFTVRVGDSSTAAACKDIRCLCLRSPRCRPACRLAPAASAALPRATCAKELDRPGPLGAAADGVSPPIRPPQAARRFTGA
mmetsp:Transcript_41134/g.74292  ORF Transcript_41134/g.74292 Transcript_41134/m.74292 type:complete len:237 (-) Transcript_41134:88-798(-)